MFGGSHESPKRISLWSLFGIKPMHDNLKTCHDNEQLTVDGGVNYHLFFRRYKFVDQCLFVNYSDSKTKFYPRQIGKYTQFKVSSTKKIIVCWGNKNNTSSKCFFEALGRNPCKSIKYLRLIRFCSKQWIRVGIWYEIIKLRPHNLCMFPILTRRRVVLSK